MILSTMHQEEIPPWAAVLAIILTGIWLLGRYEGWWDSIRNRIKQRKNNG